MKLKNIFFIISTLLYFEQLHTKCALHGPQHLVNNKKKKCDSAKKNKKKKEAKKEKVVDLLIEATPTEIETDYSETNAFIPDDNCGRFGDRLLAFAHTLYIAQKNRSKIFFIPFLYSDQLKMDDLLPKYSHEVEKQYPNKWFYSNKEVFIPKDTKNTLFQVAYFPDSAIEYKGNPHYMPFTVEWNDEEFKSELQKLISPKANLNLVIPPKNKISVAIHLRRGGSYLDNLESDLSCDLEKLCSSGNGSLIYKMPPDGYYIRQIQTLIELFNYEPLYIFIFTDDQNPQALVEKFKRSLNTPSIEFDCRKVKNDHCFNVLEDFFSLMNFDILIRPESNFSIMAEKLGNHFIVISPGTFHRGSMTLDGSINIKKRLKHIKDAI